MGYKEFCVGGSKQKQYLVLSTQQSLLSIHRTGNQQNWVATQSSSDCLGDFIKTIDQC